MKKLRLAAHAVDDLREARDFYEERSPGDGKKLGAAVAQVLTTISEHPQRFQVVHADIRRALVAPFSFAIFFRELPDAIRVIAIVHQHRNPLVWKRRR